MKLKKVLAAAIALTVSLSSTVTALAATPVYQNGFDGSLGAATALSRAGDNEDGGNAGTLPAVDSGIAAQFGEGKNGQALFLDGKYGVTLDTAAVGDTYSIAFWVNPARFSNYGPIVQIGSDLLSANTSAKWLNVTKTDWAGDATPVIWSRNEVNGAWPWYQTAYFAVDSTNPMLLEKNAWNHVVITVDGSKVGMDPVENKEVPGTVMSQLYINGKFIGEGPVASETFTGDSKVYLGINCWDIIFKGYFDDVKLYNTVLSADEVTATMNEAASSDGAAASTAAETAVPKTGEQSFAYLYVILAACVAVFGTATVVLKKRARQ